MDLRKSKNILIMAAVLYWVFVIGIYAIANEQFRYKTIEGEAPTLEFAIGEIVDGTEVHQTLEAPAHIVNGFEILAGTYSRENVGELFVELLRANGEVIASQTINVSELNNGVYTTFFFRQQAEVVPGEELSLHLTTQGCVPGNAITIYAGGSIGASSSEKTYEFGGEKRTGMLCVRLKGFNYLSFYQTYWAIAASMFCVLSLYTILSWKGAKQGKQNLIATLCAVYCRYSFLIKQLVSRDFKTKYKRSVLGMAWSFMNPLLTMSVQYIVFSTLFKSNIPNYPVYLLTGIVFFNFFNEAVTMGMTSITGNASLIKKVYIPKYIYPVSRILSSLVNFTLAFIPLLLVMLVTKTKFRPSLLLLIFDILCLLAFIIGMALLLTTAMTFFQDTQFLWGVGCMMWQYLTPVFYPESIIPAKMLPFYRLNPLYQYITFARTCIIDGISPGPEAYFYCLFSAVIVLILGTTVFKKHQNKFVLYL